MRLNNFWDEKLGPSARDFPRANTNTDSSKQEPQNASVQMPTTFPTDVIAFALDLMATNKQFAFSGH